MIDRVISVMMGESRARPTEGCTRRAGRPGPELTFPAPPGKGEGDDSNRRDDRLVPGGAGDPGRPGPGRDGAVEALGAGGRAGGRPGGREPARHADRAGEPGDRVPRRRLRAALRGARD